jgi:hypothetical protein
MKYPFGIFLPGGGWSYDTAPIMTYSHESEEWMIPLNLVIGKTVTINSRPCGRFRGSARRRGGMSWLVS